jgi:hypothetical protein
MRKRYVFAALTLTVLAAACEAQGDGLQSGPQVGKAIPGPFHPLNVTGDAAGKKNCLIWQNGGNPVAMIFAREVSDSLTSLVKQIDAETAKNSKKNMGSFVVFLSDKEGLETQLKEWADKQNLKQCVLTIDNVAGPEGYDVAKDADVTVVLYNRRKVEANFAFRKGELNDKAIEQIVKDVSKIVK